LAPAGHDRAHGRRARRAPRDGRAGARARARTIRSARGAGPHRGPLRRSDRRRRAVVSPEEDDEARLVARANAGDAGALAALYRAHRGWVAALALRFTGNQADALDVLQETFLYLFRRLPLPLTTSLPPFP